MRSISFRRALYLGASAASLLVLGLIYAWSIFSGPLAAYTGHPSGDLQVAFSISICCFFLGTLAGALIGQKLSLCQTLLVAAGLLFVGFAGTATWATADVRFIYFFYGVCCATGCGIGYNTLIASVGLWFPDKTGLATGTMSMGFGLGGLVLGSLAHHGMAVASVPTVFYGLAALGLLVLGGMALWLRPAPADIAQQLGTVAARRVDAAKIREGFAPSTLLFWVYCLYACCAICLGISIIGSAKPGGEAVGLSAGAAALLVGLVSTFNGASRVAVGLLYDRAGLLVSFGVIAGIGLLATGGVALAYAEQWPGVYAVSAIALGAAYGGVPVAAAGFAREAYGAKHYALNFSLINLNGALAALLGQGVVSAASANGTAAEGQVWQAMLGVALISALAVGVFARLYRQQARG